VGGNLPPESSSRDRGSRLPATRLPALLCTLIVALPLLVVTSVPEALAAEPEILLGRSRVGEYQPVRGDNLLAWQQNTRQRPGHYDVYARPIDGGGKFKVNAGGTNGANGGIEGDVLVYQQFTRKKSDLKFFDLAARSRSSPPTGVNTDQWEYWPSMSDEWLLFARLYGNDVRRIFLFELSTGDSLRLGQVRGTHSFLAPGQVSGDWAVWSTCRQNQKVCDVIRYHIPDGTRETIPNNDRSQHAPSVTPDGTVYFARSNGRCGGNVKLIRHPLEGAETVLWRISSGDDVGSTKTFVDQQGMTTVLFDQFDCDQPAGSDAWEIVEDSAPKLTVTLEGDASGTVTSSPPGINCGSDCTELYDLGTGVTLTAKPEGGAAFAGWSGACTGSSTTCTLTMDSAKSVTATFTNKPVLSVSKSGSGQGTVTSSPAGINCGGDCNEPYAQGTTVTLTAAPNSDSTFGGWSGACGGTNLTCNVTMDTDKSVTATFALKPQLTVAKSGTGQGTVSGSGINCDPDNTDCQERYDPGTEVTLTATPDALSTFGGWTNCDAVQVDNTCKMTMNADKTVTATFDPII
jgi:List-Bact-rpt repeat protein